MTDRKTIIAGNWKMNKTSKEAGELAKAVVSGLPSSGPLPEIVMCPPFTAIEAVSSAIAGSPVKLGAQNLDHRQSGAFTGEISGPMLVGGGCSYVLIGHSERRQFFGETNQTVPLRVKAALDNKLTPVICVGELLDERESDLTDNVVSRQVGAAVSGLSEDEIELLVFAYEPVWAIGTGKVCEAPEAARVCASIRKTLKQFLKSKPDASQKISVLYDGSMNAANADELLAQDEIDGGLIGGASLKSEDFLSIVKSAAKRPRLASTSK